MADTPRRSDDPFKPLTHRQQQVANLLGRGWAYKRIAAALKIEPETVQTHINEIAAKLPNPDDLAAGTLVMLWSAHRIWRNEPPTDSRVA